MSLSVIDFLRDVGKHFPVNRMLARDVVSRRLEAASPTPSSATSCCSRWTSSTSSATTASRCSSVAATSGATSPPVSSWSAVPTGARRTRSRRRWSPSRRHQVRQDRGRRLWLDPAMMSPYAFHQFWLNVEDEKVGELLRIFTFLSREEIEDLEAQTAEKPSSARAGRPGRRGHHPGARRRGDRPGQGCGGRPFRRRRAGRTRPFDPGLGVAGGRPCRCHAPTGCRRSTCWWRPACARARRRPPDGLGGRCLRQQRAGGRPDHVPDDSALLGGSWLVVRRGKKNLAGVEVV